jgi:TIR domain
MPSLFVSYSRESDAHVAWVRQLAVDLRGKGVDATLDDWDLKPGDDLSAFMERVSDADYLLIVCTVAYAEKANARRGGVGYEQQIITGGLLTDDGVEQKLIPILRSGVPSTALPRYLKTRLFIDFRNDDHYEAALNQIVRHLSGQHARPPLGASQQFQAASARAVAHTPPAQWVLVAGIGRPSEMTEAVALTATKLGELLGTIPVGLITCGWPGVDEVVARAFASAMLSEDAALEDYLVQVVVNEELPAFPAGDLILVKRGRDEWTVAIDRADVIVLIGGIGGTWETGEIALERGKPVLPLADTGGDAKKMYMHLLANWGRYNVGNLTKQQFLRLGRMAPDVAADAIDVIRAVVHPSGAA